MFLDGKFHVEGAMFWSKHYNEDAGAMMRYLRPTIPYSPETIGTWDINKHD
jgi:hypothetical protein